MKFCCRFSCMGLELYHFWYKHFSFESDVLNKTVETWGLLGAGLETILKTIVDNYSDSAPFFMVVNRILDRMSILFESKKKIQIKYFKSQRVVFFLMNIPKVVEILFVCSRLENGVFGYSMVFHCRLFLMISLKVRFE